MRFENVTQDELKGRSFRMSDGRIITVEVVDPADVPHFDRRVVYRADKRELPDAGRGSCWLASLESLVEVREES